MRHTLPTGGAATGTVEANRVRPPPVGMADAKSGRAGCSAARPAKSRQALWEDAIGGTGGGGL